MPEPGVASAPLAPPPVRALAWEEGALVVLDQRLLPGATVRRRLGHLSEVAEAIRTLTVRGAPTIGVAAAYGMVLGQRVDRLPVDEAARLLRETRPTAQDLFVGIAQVERAWRAGEDTLSAALAYEERLVRECQAIGEAGAPLMGRGARVLTHCNAGALATVAWGTALAPVRVAYRSGRDPFVWVDETRPLLQGSRLTAWELREEGIRHAVIADNAAGYFMSRGEVDLVIVGADRITRSGDFANKVGTYEKAVLAREHGVPFYVAAPWSTFDASLSRGDQIPVEERSGEEVRNFAGTATTPEGSPVRNPAFDLTPHRFVRGFITPDGVLAPEDLEGRLRARNLLR
jgi:S-methyl-5-thioribose-1-phosphate isomerase